MSEAGSNPEQVSPWLGAAAPCVYCGHVIPRDADRCPQCRTSFSVAVRKASREVIGSWYYLDPRNPSGRGVTLETLLKMIEKGRLRPDSIVRGPTTQQDWLYAAEVPRLAKYFGLCPHCFAEAKPEDTYCTQCQLNMNQRPGEPRPGIPPYLVKAPHHKTAYEVEMQLANEAIPPATETLGGEDLVTPVPPPAPAAKAPAPAPAARTPPSTPILLTEELAAAPATSAASAAADLATAVSEKRSGVAAAARRRRPRIWMTLILTWVTLVLVAALVVLVPPLRQLLPEGLRTGLTGVFGGPRPGDGSHENPTNPPGDAWLNQRLAEATEAERGGDYPRAITILRAAINKTSDPLTAQTLEARVRDIRDKIKKADDEERKAALAKLVDRLRTAQGMADKQDFENALAILTNIGDEDRRTLSATGVSVQKMEADFRARQAKWLAEKERAKQQEDALLAQIGLAEAAEKAGKLKEALDLAKKIVATFPPELVQKHHVQVVIDDLQVKLAAGTQTPDSTNPSNKPPPTPAATSPKEIADEIKGICDQSAALEKQEKFEEARTKLEEIKQKYDEKYWPEKLKERIEQLKAREEALKFFGIGGTKKP